MGLATVGTEGNDRVSVRGDFLDDLWVGTIVGTDFAVIIYGIEGNLRFRGVEGLKSREIGGFTYDLHFLGVALSKVADNAGQAVVVAEAKMTKKEEAHFLLRGGGVAICYMGSVGLGLFRYRLLIMII